jgi:riboflavin kinase/FMN adenylyltransferase
MKRLEKIIQFSGKVIEGKKLGRQIGFPTANLDPKIIADNLKLISGIYAGTAQIKSKPEIYISAIYIGKNATLTNNNFTVEAHFLDFNQDIYGKIIILKLLAFVREDKKFANTNQLVEQIKKDCMEIKKFCENENVLN